MTSRGAGAETSRRCGCAAAAVKDVDPATSQEHKCATASEQPLNKEKKSNLPLEMHANQCARCPAAKAAKASETRRERRELHIVGNV